MASACEPHLQAEHMAAPTNAANVKKVLANPEPSTHGRFCCKSLFGMTNENFQRRWRVLHVAT